VMQQASSADIARTEADLRRQSPTDLAKMVEDLRYDTQYAFGPDSLAWPGVPKGKIFEFTFDKSRVFPGTKRKITVYVPAEYSGERPASVYVGLDYLGFNAPMVFDNLIFSHEMPVTIAIGGCTPIHPGNPPKGCVRCGRGG